MIGKHFLSTADTSIVTAISGVGNDFTVYGKVRAFKAGKTADVAIIFSGTMENKTIKNFKIGLICISNKNTVDNPFIKEGQGRVIVEKDKLSERITEKDFTLTVRKNPLIQLYNSGSKH